MASGDCPPLKCISLNHKKQEMAKLPEKWLPAMKGWIPWLSTSISTHICTYIHTHICTYVCVHLFWETCTHTQTQTQESIQLALTPLSRGFLCAPRHYSVCLLGTTEAIYHRTTNLIMLFIIPLGGDLSSASSLTATRMALDPPEWKAGGEGSRWAGSL